MKLSNFLIRIFNGPGNVTVDYAEDFDEAFNKAYRQKNKANRVDVFDRSGKHFLKITRDGDDKNG